MQNGLQLATPHITRNDRNRSSNVDRRTTRHRVYAVSLSRHWLVEKGFGWLTQTGPLRQVKLRGLGKVDWLFVFGFARLITLPAAETDRAAVCLNLEANHRKPLRCRKTPMNTD